MPQKVSLSRLLLEAEQLAFMVERHWTRLRSVEGGRLREGTPATIRALTRAIRRAPLDARRRSGSSALPLVARARALLREIRSAMAAYAQLRGAPELQAALARLDDRAPARAGAIAALAAALETRALLALPLRHELDGFGGFEGATLDRAREIVAELRALPAKRSDERATRSAQKGERDRNLAELAAIVRDVRAAARFVFRDEPELARPFTSEHERRARRARRAAKKEGESASSS